jgi:glycosyltransferase involved in cell wall biosynthesis
MRSLRIAMIAPPWYEVPPRAYGGIEALIAPLVDTLVARGHEVLLVAAGTPGTSAHHLITMDPSPSDMVSDEVIASAHHARAIAALDDFAPDVVHVHTPVGLLWAMGGAYPVVATVHGPPEGALLDLLTHAPPTCSLVAISEQQRHLAPSVRWCATVPNGIDVGAVPVGSGGEYLAFLGRMCPEKGAHTAIDVAQATGRRIVLAGRRRAGIEADYFEAEITPRLGAQTTWIGEADRQVKYALLGSAAALIFPLEWEEPYGLVVAEAQACGTPVITFPRGAMPDLVRDGVTGFLCRDVDDMVSAVQKVHILDRQRVRQHALEQLDIGATASGYERVYWEAVERTSAMAQPAARTPRWE